MKSDRIVNSSACGWSGCIRRSEGRSNKHCNHIMTWTSSNLNRKISHLSMSSGSTYRCIFWSDPSVRRATSFVHSFKSSNKSQMENKSVLWCGSKDSFRERSWFELSTKVTGNIRDWVKMITLLGCRELHRHGYNNTMVVVMKTVVVMLGQLSPVLRFVFFIDISIHQIQPWPPPCSDLSLCNSILWRPLLPIS